MLKVYPLINWSPWQLVPTYLYTLQEPPKYKNKRYFHHLANWGGLRYPVSGTRAKDQISEATILLVPSPPHLQWSQGHCQEWRDPETKVSVSHSSQDHNHPVSITDCKTGIVWKRTVRKAATQRWRSFAQGHRCTHFQPPGLATLMVRR